MEKQIKADGFDAWLWGKVTAPPAENIEEEDEDIEEDEEDMQPEDEDLTSSDGTHWYQSGRLVLTIDEDEDRDMALAAYMNQEQFWPNCWQISDHGNAHLLSTAS